MEIAKETAEIIGPFLIDEFNRQTRQIFIDCDAKPFI